jgi:hypothetical protein
MSEKSEKNIPFVVTDRRKFTLDGEPRPDADPRTPREARDVSPAQSAPLEFKQPEPVKVSNEPPVEATPDPNVDPDLPPPPTPSEIAQAATAYYATAQRLDDAMRSANPGMERPPTINFDQVVQSIYMSAIMQLGGTTPEGQQPQIDLMGARQSIDMLGILADRTKGNLSAQEQMLLDSALFELRMGFLEVTQALARSAAARAQPAAGSPGGPPPGRPSIVR